MRWNGGQPKSLNWSLFTKLISPKYFMETFS